MSFRLYTLIKITQQPNSVDSARNTTFTIDFVESLEIKSSWQNLTDTAKIKLPRNIVVQDDRNGKNNWGAQVGESGKNIYNSDNGASPLFMRGDKIKITLGYYYDPMDGTDEVLVTDDVFDGYITKIQNRMPIEINCEDTMWKLKQLKAPNKLFKGSEYTVQKMLTELLQGTGITVIDGTDQTIQTNIGDFRTQNESVASVLERLRRDGSLYSYFRGDQLRCSGIVYYPQDRVDHVFKFQENIISDQLQYNRKEDLEIAIKAHAEYLDSGSGTNNDGTPKTKRKRIEVLVGKDGVISDEKTFTGDVVSIPVLGATTKEVLIQKAKEYLPKFYYTGFKGSFVTFGQPSVKHGDAAIIRDSVIPERNGTYLIKEVTKNMSLIGGYKQTILLHLRIDKGFTQDQLNAGI